LAGIVGLPTDEADEADQPLVQTLEVNLLYLLHPWADP
jgi:hypothetical protein